MIVCDADGIADANKDMPYKSAYGNINIQQTNILSYVFDEGRENVERPIWIDADNASNKLSPKQMLLWIKRFALGLENLGIEEGRAIMVFSPNHIYVPMAYLAAAGSKRIFTGANPSYTKSEVAFQMKNIEAAVVLIHPSLLDTGIAAAKEIGLPTNRLFMFSDTECKPTKDIQDWRTMCATEDNAQHWQWDDLRGETSAKTIACVNYSSGTTGLPKGVCITHHNLISNSAQSICAKLWDTGCSEKNPGHDVWLAFLPLYHAYSQLWTINIACRLQIPVYVMSKFVYEDFLRHIQTHRITALQAVPPICVMLNKRPETKKYDISSLKHLMVGAAPLSSDLQKEVMKQHDLTITQAWGMTETTCAGAMMPYRNTEDIGFAGWLLPNTEAKLVDEENKEITKEGLPGELCVRGPQMMLEYWRNEKATRETKEPDGWLHTGDIAVCKDNRLWRIVDRKKELIKVKGLQVAPAELEGLLLENDAIADAAVVGMTLNEEEFPRAYVVLAESARGRTTERDVQRFVEGRVSKHKWLKGGVKFIDEVPKLASGKIIRKLTKEWAKRDAKELERTSKPRL